MEARDFYVNATKKLIIEVDGKTYARHAIQIPFVNVGDDYDALVCSTWCRCGSPATSSR